MSVFTPPPSNLPQRDFDNPRNAAAEYANTVLGGVGSGQVALPTPRGPGKATMGQTRSAAPTVSDRVGMVQRSTSNQHQLRMKAIGQKRAMARAQAYGTAPQMGTSAPHKHGGGGRAFEPGGNYGLTVGATRALASLNQAYRQQFGSDLVVNSGGRSYEEQARAYAAYKAGRGNLAAPPGTSVHESGRAVDLGGPIQNAGSAQHRWLQANAGRYGWVWTGKNFSQFEPWHWEFHG